MLGRPCQDYEILRPRICKSCVRTHVPVLGSCSIVYYYWGSLVLRVAKAASPPAHLEFCWGRLGDPGAINGGSGSGARAPGPRFRAQGIGPGGGPRDRAPVRGPSPGHGAGARGHAGPGPRTRARAPGPGPRAQGITSTQFRSLRTRSEHLSPPGGQAFFSHQVHIHTSVHRRGDFLG